MNRREMFKKIVGVVAVGVAMPTIAQAKTHGLLANSVPGIPVGPSPAYKEPPKDMRTPEQVWEDDLNQDVKRYTNKDYHWYGFSESYKNVCQVRPEAYDRIKAVLQERGELELMTIGTREFIIINGNPLTIW